MKKRSDRYKINKLKLVLLILLSIILFAGSVILWARFISTNGLVVNERKIVNEKLPNSFKGFKIIHFSDVHYGKTIFKKNLEKIVNKINFINPDLVVFTGDLIDKDTKVNDNTITEISEILSKINSKYGKYAVKGNHDYSDDNFYKIMNDSNFNVLENSYDLIYCDINEYIYIGGLTSSIKTVVDYNKTLDYFKDNKNENIFSIMLFHEPDNIEEINKVKKVDLALSGHSHGGQIRLPFIGNIIKTKGAIKYPNDYYKIDNTDLYVSYGLGTTTYPFRFMNKPSINFYRLYKK